MLSVLTPNLFIFIPVYICVYLCVCVSACVCVFRVLNRCFLSSTLTTLHNDGSNHSSSSGMSPAFPWIISIKSRPQFWISWLFGLFLLTQFCKRWPLEFKTIFKFQGWSTDDSLWVWNVLWNKHLTKMKGLKKRGEVREFYGFYSSLSTRLRKFSSSLEKLSHNFTSEKINLFFSLNPATVSLVQLKFDWNSTDRACITARKLSCVFWSGWRIWEGLRN